MSSLLLEKKKKELIDQSKNADVVKRYGTTRYLRRSKVHAANTVAAFNRVDMNSFFKADLLSFKIPVAGETADYEVELLFEGACEQIKNQVEQNNNKFEFKCVYRAIIDAINKKDILVSCSCPDWCLDENTQIKLLNNEVITVKELKEKIDKGEEVWVYSTDEKGDFKPGKVTDAWISGYTKDMVKVTLDNGKEILTTPNHKYMLRDGSYLQAADLNVGQSLMPLYFRLNSKGYEDVKLNSKPITSYYSLYKLVADAVLQKEIKEAKVRSAEDVVAIHHKDFNKLNNYPTNLYPMGKDEHYLWHANHTKESGAYEKWRAAAQAYNELTCDHTTKEYEQRADVMRKALWGEEGYYNNRSIEEIERDYKLHSAGTKAAWERGCFDTEAFHNAAKNNGANLHTPEGEKLSAEGVRNYWANLSEDDKKGRSKIAADNGRKGAEKLRGKKMSSEFCQKIKDARKNETEEHKELRNRKIRDAKILKVLNSILSAGEKICQETYKKYRYNGAPNPLNHWDTFEDCVNYFNLNENYNHKIAKIEKIHYEIPKPVYDLSVDKWNNFYVDAGVILHNCYRFAVWATKDKYNSGPSEVRLADITNPNNSKGAGCKHVLNILSNLDWAMKLASTVNNYVRYMEEHYKSKFVRFIFPKIYSISFEEYSNDSTQYGAGDADLVNTMKNDTKEIDTSNKEGKDRGKFKSKEEESEE